MSKILESNTYTNISKRNFKKVRSEIEGDCYLTPEAKDVRITALRLNYLESLKNKAAGSLDSMVLLNVKDKMSKEDGTKKGLIKICYKTSNKNTLSRVQKELDTLVTNQISFLEEIIGL